jgi:uncharacterized damage-inducible protein DinB
MRHWGRLLRYDVWANRETLRSLMQSAPPRSLEWLGHIVGAEYLWMARLRRRHETLPVWPVLDVKACGERLDELSRLWPEYLEDAPDSLTEAVPYTNSKGEAWTNTVEEILTHVVIHSAYHRGQIASDVRANGGVPAPTDYIHAVRHRLIE